MWKFVNIVITLLVANSDAARILAFFTIPSISHQIVFRPLTQELVKRGHEVTVITTDPAFPKGKAPANLTEIDLHDISYEIWNKNFISTDITKGSNSDWIEQAKLLYVAALDIFVKQMMNEEVTEAVFNKSKKYDLLLLEASMSATLGLSYVHKVPVIKICSFGASQFNLQTVGAPMHLFRQPTPFQQRVTNLSLWDKINELYTYFRIQKIPYSLEITMDEALKQIFGQDIPNLFELRKNVDMLFLNVHSLWEINRPMPPNVILMGGLHQNLPKELPQDLKSYLDSSVNGVIYVSFGTNVEPSLLPSDRIQMLVNAFSKLPYDVLWKWNQDVLPGKSSNIRISKWLPQSDLLRHPKLKLFITQGGLQSTDESITAGVPLIGIPFLGDQWYNTDLYDYYKIGTKLILSTLDEENLLNAINTVITDESYRNNVAKLRAIMKDESQTPLERAVWWTEYVLRHGGAKHLRSPLASLTWVEYLELELVLYLITALLSLILTSAVLIYFLYKITMHLCKRNAKLKKK